MEVKVQYESAVARTMLTGALTSALGLNASLWVQSVNAGIKGQRFRRFCSQEKNLPSARTQYVRYTRF